MTAGLRRRKYPTDGMRAGPRRAGTKADESEGAALPLATLATRIPKALHQRVKVFCFEQELRLQDFVAAALAGRLHRAKQGRRRVVR